MVDDESLQDLSELIESGKVNKMYLFKAVEEEGKCKES